MKIQKTKRCNTCNTEKQISIDFARLRFKVPPGEDKFEKNCRQCNKASKEAERLRKWQSEHPTIVASFDGRKRIIDNQNKSRLNKHRHLQQKFGISIEDYDYMLLTQNYVCAICGNYEPGQSLVVDHDHDTNKIRGLLCSQCNLGIGQFKDQADLLIEAIKYIEYNNTLLKD